MGTKQASLVDVVYYKLKSDFANNTIASGEKLVTRSLAERYQTSETPIKQALNRLVSEGLVEAIPGRGMRRKEWRLEDVEDILEVRLMIETFFAPKMVNHIDFNMESLTNMQSYLEQHRDAILHLDGPGAYVRMYELDRNFHHEYVKCTGNQKIIQIYNALETHTYENFIYGQKSQARLLMGVEEHMEIIGALSARNADALVKAVTKHIKNAGDTFRAAFKLGKINA